MGTVPVTEPVMGTDCNPWNTDHTPGGSSGQCVSRWAWCRWRMPRWGRSIRIPTACGSRRVKNIAREFRQGLTEQKRASVWSLRFLTQCATPQAPRCRYQSASAICHCPDVVDDVLEALFFLTPAPADRNSGASPEGGTVSNDCVEGRVCGQNVGKLGAFG